ncbi:MAG: methionyl-tRNA formyltransferase [Micrococcus sp.]|nr:methionyl-tRNA formyltransferase [Micrococcus sp.]
MRVVFAGTPQVAVPVLDALAESEHELVGVLTRPDAPQGRKRVLTPSPVAARAAELGVETVKASRLRGERGTGSDGTETHGVGLADRLTAWQADVVVVVAYGALVPAELLAMPTLGWLNLHFSDLPAYRGAAPVQWAMIEGRTRLDAVVFQLETGLDTGPVFDAVTHELNPGETAGEALEALAQAGGPLVTRVLDTLAAGTATAVPQTGEVSHAPKLSLTDALIDPARDATAVAAHLNGVTPEPGAWGWLRGTTPSTPGQPEPPTIAPTRLKLRGALPSNEDELPAAVAHAQPGTVLLEAREAWLRTAPGAVRISELQPAGKPMMVAADYLRGAAQTPVLLSGSALAAHREHTESPSRETVLPKGQARA